MDAVAGSALLEALKPVLGPAIGAAIGVGIVLLLQSGFSALGQRFPRTTLALARVQMATLLVTIVIGLDRAYRGDSFKIPAVVAVLLFCTLVFTAAAMRRAQR